MTRKKSAAALLFCAVCLSGSVAAYAAVETSAETAWKETTPYLASGSAQIDAEAEGWVEEDDGMHYYEDGIEVTGQGFQIEGKWYYFDENGVSM